MCVACFVWAWACSNRDAPETRRDPLQAASQLLVTYLFLGVLVPLLSHCCGSNVFVFPFMGDRAPHAQLVTFLFVLRCGSENNCKCRRFKSSLCRSKSAPSVSSGWNGRTFRLPPRPTDATVQIKYISFFLSPGFWIFIAQLPDN